jgi:hypothetical protein
MAKKILDNPRGVYNEIHDLRVRTEVIIRNREVERQRENSIPRENTLFIQVFLRSSYR